MPQRRSAVEDTLAEIAEQIAKYGDAAILDRVHPLIATHAQANARFSTTDPPMATTPEDLRDLYMPDDEWPWFAGDWDQQELRIIAALANDEPLLEAFRNGWDVHTLNAGDIFELPYPPDLKDPHKAASCAAWRETRGWKGKDDPRRVFAKRFVYRLNYGGDPRGAGNIPGAKALGLTPVRLVRASHNFLRKHPNLAAWRRRTETETAKTHIVRAFTGRRRVLFNRRKKAVREAFDYPMQAGGAEMLIMTILALHEAFGDKVRYIYSMHDSLVLGVHRSIWSPETLVRLADILERPWRINNTDLVVPATFYTREGSEGKQEWKRPETGRPQ